MTMQCTEFEQILEQQPDGPLPAAASAHRDSCQDCRLLWDDLEAIRIAGRDWGAEEGAPPEHLWRALRAQLESEGLIASPVPEVSRSWRMPRVPRLAMAGAYLAVLLLAAALVGYRGYRSETASLARQSAAAAAPAAPAAAAPAAADIGKTLDADMKRVLASFPSRDSQLTESLQRNLGIVDNLIAMCEKSAREQPNNPLVREYLYGAYQQKADLLATATDRSTLENQ
jgi:hypothetical protein